MIPSQQAHSFLESVCIKTCFVSLPYFAFLSCAQRLARRRRRQTHARDVNFSQQFVTRLITVLNTATLHQPCVLPAKNCKKCCVLLLRKSTNERVALYRVHKVIIHCFKIITIYGCNRLYPTAALAQVLLDSVSFLPTFLLGSSLVSDFLPRLLSY